jgi:hypothetical protein
MTPLLRENIQAGVDQKTIVNRSLFPKIFGAFFGLSSIFPDK